MNRILPGALILEDMEIGGFAFIKMVPAQALCHCFCLSTTGRRFCYRSTVIGGSGAASCHSLCHRMKRDLAKVVSPMKSTSPQQTSFSYLVVGARAELHVIPRCWDHIALASCLSVICIKIFPVVTSGILGGIFCGLHRIAARKITSLVACVYDCRSPRLLTSSSLCRPVASDFVGTDQLGPVCLRSALSRTLAITVET